MKFRVSHVEAFRKWEADEESDTAELIQQITGQWEGNQATRAGTAFHKVLENSKPGDVFESAEADGFRFEFLQDFSVYVPSVREVRACGTYLVDGQRVLITGQLDAIDGLRVIDHKTTSRFDPDRYLGGYQWRLYLDIFGGNEFVWNVYEIDSPDDSDPNFYIVKAAHTLSQYRYPALHDDCQALVERFARFVREHVREAA